MHTFICKHFQGKKVAILGIATLIIYFFMIFLACVK